MPARQRNAEEIVGNNFTQRNHGIYFYTVSYRDFMVDIRFPGSFLCDLIAYFRRFGEKITHSKLRYDFVL